MRIAEDIDEDIKKALSDLSHLYESRPNATARKPEFGDSIFEQLLVTHALVQSKPDEPLKQEAKLVCEIVVTEDMLNGGGNMHGGCSAFLIDLCATLSLVVYERGMHVSQSLSIVYHSPATLRDNLRIINTTMAVGTRAMSARTEIWNATQHRLVASGVLAKIRLKL
ncbi:HotDog domain-containing protein [Mycena capillaripes]|nr:HotDog domain-containing protein [Mycena capillaripes]